MDKNTLSLPTRARTLFVILVLAACMILAGAAYAQSGVVQVVLFYSPYCGHCQQVIAEVLPPISESYNTRFTWSYFGDLPDDQSGQLPAIVAFEGDVLQILYVDTTTQEGSQLFAAAVKYFDISPDDQAVPTMVIGEELLIGSVDIPNRMPGLVDAWLGQGGLAWPAIPGLAEIAGAVVSFPELPQEAPPEAQDLPAESDTAPIEPAEGPADLTFEIDRSRLSVMQRIQLDPLGNSLAIVVLIGMLFSVAGVAVRWRLLGAADHTRALPALLPLLMLLGIFVAGYLSFVETSGAEAVCGPVGDCNAVQSSEYALLFGLIPVGYLGLVGYLGMLVAWVLSRRTSGSTPDTARLALFAMALLGVLFSIYLTFLEPFVLGATCLWCLSSAIIITMIMILTVEHARGAYRRLRLNSG